MAETPDYFALSTEQACRLTGLSNRRLRYWSATEFFSPSVVNVAGRAFGRIYSFRDIVGLRTIAELRRRVSLQELRQVGEWLQHQHETPWASLRFYVDAKKKVHFREPDSGKVTRAGAGQAVLEVALEEIVADVQQRVRTMSARGDDQVGRIERKRNIAHNAPVLAGTRIPTAAIWNFHEAGFTTEQILREYPRLTVEDIRSALTYERGRREQSRAG